MKFADKDEYYLSKTRILRITIKEQAAEIKRLRGAFESIKDDYAFTQEAGLDNRTYAYYETACKALEPVKEGG
jgi:hypothetical protein